MLSGGLLLRTNLFIQGGCSGGVSVGCGADRGSTEGVDSKVAAGLERAQPMNKNRRANKTTIDEVRDQPTVRIVALLSVP